MAIRVILSGSNGFIGRNVASFFKSCDIEVIALSRIPKQKNTIYWDYKKKEIDLTSFGKVEGIIHLSGEPVAGFWSCKKKRDIYSSRIESTKFLVESLDKLSHYPKVFICASAIGYYGSRKDEKITEESYSGRGFLSNVCQDWEKACDPIREKCRVLNFRFGHVLGKDGGILPLLKKQYLWYLGGRIGKGNQYISSITIDDVVRIFHFCLQNPNISGPVNVVSPYSVQQKEFGKILARSLARPFWLHVPEKMLSIICKEQAQEMLLSSLRVVPQKLMDSNFLFRDQSLQNSIEKYI